MAASNISQQHRHRWRHIMAALQQASATRHQRKCHQCHQAAKWRHGIGWHGMA